MTKRQNLKLVMYLAVIKTLRQQLEDGAAGPAVEAELSRLEALVAEIQATARQRVTELPGVTLTRTLLRKQLEEKTYQLSKALVNWARAGNELELLTKVDFPYSELARTRGTFLAERVQFVVLTARPVGDALAPYGADAALIEEVAGLLLRYRERMPDTRTALSRRRAGTQLLNRQYKAADEVLKSLDSLLETARGSVPYLRYRSVRKLAGANRTSSTARAAEAATKA